MKTEEIKFVYGDIIVNDEFTVIGAYSHESIDPASGISWPTFSIAANNGRLFENFDDIECNDWPGEYRYATDEEIEIFLKEIEDLTNFVWNPTTHTLEVRDESSWKIPNYVYPDSWSEAEKQYSDCWRYTEELLEIGEEDSFSGSVFTLGKLILLKNIYEEGNRNVKGEVSYAIVKSRVCNKLECRPYIYGTRNSIMSFRFQEQARLFMTNFEDLLLNCINLL